MNLTAWPFRTYIVDHNNRVIYLPIPRVASTCLSIWFTEYFICDKHFADDPQISIHPFIRQSRYCLWSEPYAEQILKYYFKFTFVRNPFSRLVSTYLNKFANVNEDKHYHYFVKQVYQYKNEPPDIKKGISFEEFIEFLYMRNSKETFDVHWRPQHLFLSDVQLDFIGKFENFQADITLLQKCLFVHYSDPQKINSTLYDQNRPETDCLWKIPGGELKRLLTFPPYKYFYSNEIVSQVREIYSKDFSTFGYDLDQQFPV